MHFSPLAAKEVGTSWTQRRIRVQNIFRGAAGTHVACAASRGFVIKRIMRFHAKSGLFFLLLYLAAIRPGLAQRQEDKERQVGTNGAGRVTRGVSGVAVHRQLSPNEGLAI